MKGDAAVYLLAINLLTFLTFGVDKWKAKRGSRRIPEIWLLGLALPLGAPGAWVGAKVFRHKTRKASFLWKLALVTALNAGLLWLAWPRFRG